MSRKTDCRCRKPVMHVTSLTRRRAQTNGPPPAESELEQESRVWGRVTSQRASVCDASVRAVRRSRTRGNHQTPRACLSGASNVVSPAGQAHVSKRSLCCHEALGVVLDACGRPLSNGARPPETPETLEVGSALVVRSGLRTCAARYCDSGSVPGHTSCPMALLKSPSRLSNIANDSFSIALLSPTSAENEQLAVPLTEGLSPSCDVQTRPLLM